MNTVEADLSGAGTAVIESNASPPARFVELDALRGLAALMVVFYHFAFETKVYHQGHSKLIILLRPFIAGHEAVILFFLLSGFVLSLSTWKGRVIPYPQYLVRRACRIYLPYLAALALAVCACFVSHHVLLTPGWAARSWPLPITTASIVQHIAFIGDYNNTQYNGAFWSLVVEMRLSLVFPGVLFVLVRMRSRAALLSAAAISTLAVAMILLYPASSWTRYRGGLYTVHYLAFFIVGALLARRLSSLPWPRLSDSVRHAMVVLSILLFAYGARVLRIAPHWGSGPVEMMTDWIIALGGVGLIYLAATHHTVKRTLGHFIPRYLGHISYSVYLVHNVVLSWLLILFHNRLSITWVFPFYIVLTIGAASLFYYTVELPAMRLGRRLTQSASRPLSA
ncbi:MAG TPA: acyltransferase [Acidisarcina sp.]